ncbi:unnamed protein product [Allacma fusca]|uniref:Conserved oligomeric Golgi complex subunit 3 n=1 Tax=Allacma fusca TaxID=39272 RepID=A0A8J2LUG8_9HEXA|nr:unnamed protein product [Allacma fusca]
MSSAVLTKYKERISLYEDIDNPLAPLTTLQRQFILDVTHGDNQRQPPESLRSIPVHKSVVLDKGYVAPGDVDWNKFQFKTKREFNEWFLRLESQLEEDKDADIIAYTEVLKECKGETEKLLSHVQGSLDELRTLQDNYHYVSNKTNSLHNSCQQLIEEQSKLETVSKEVESSLNHFLYLDRIASKLNSPSLLVTSDAFFALLEQIDTCLSFMVHNPSFKESSTYAAKYKHCLNRAISTIKTYVTKSLQETTNVVTAAVQAQSKSEDSAVFPIIYGKFAAGIAKLKRIFVEVDNRRTGWPEYGELFQEIQQAFFKERSNLLNGSVYAMVGELAAKGKTGVDLCLTVRTGCSFCIHICQDEFRLYGDFFNPSYTVHFDEFMERLCTPLYDTLRPLIIKIQHLETLAELCTILRVEMLDEQASTSPQGLASFVRIVEQLLQDTQERLVYRAHIYISTDIRNYVPGPGDLAYPEKLEMMEHIAETLEQQQLNEIHHKPFGRSTSQTSLVSMSSVTSQEVAAINSAAALQIPRPLKSSSSPADLHGMWFPSVRRTLLCLSKLYRCLDKAIFQGLSQEALTACISNVSLSAQQISARKTIVDAQLFEIKHLLILREQIAPFQVDFAVKEMSLDFSRVKLAALSLLQKKKQLFSLNSNNSLLEFIVEGTPQVKEYFLDSKKEVDRQLKSTCESFITHCTQILLGPMRSFISKALKVVEAQKEKPDLVLSQQSFALPNTVSQLIVDTVESLKSKLPFIHRSMKLYLANRETEFILFRPVKNNVLNGFLQLENLLVVHYANLDVPIVCPTQEHVNVLISSLMIQPDQNK